MSTEPRIYVASLADYNAGHLHGVWIDLAPYSDPDDVFSEINDMLSSSREPIAEDWAIHDHEGIPGGCGEHDPIVEVLARVALMKVHDLDAASAAMEAADGDADRARVLLTDGYYGKWRSLEEWAMEYLDGCGIIPDGIARDYFDFERWGRDAVMSGDVFTVDSGRGVFVFSTHV